MNDLPPVEVMKRAFYDREGAFDGIFFTAVRTTNVFCRPSCAARKPLEKNIAFFASARDALFAGFRPCLRCTPMDRGETPDWVRAILGKVEADPHERLRDGDLRRMGVEPARARRWFQARYGMTFHAYARAVRLGDALRRIRSGEPIDDVAIASGWESHSGFREAFGRFFGEAPRSASSRDPILATMIDSPLGPLVAAAVDEGVCLLEFTDRRMLEKQMKTLHRHFGRPVAPGTHRHLDTLRTGLDAYFAGRPEELRVPISAPGTEFQQKVWAAVRAIPPGQTRSYAEIAKQIGTPGAVRAVGTANGMNRLAILIPCHRVITSEGTFGGYGGGIWRKKRLLEIEAAAVTRAESTRGEGARTSERLPLLRR
ncbi:MAG: bifunctional transcriptional activator/DNA repair enzyme AdaA [Thermoanaerobaculia bacterium]